MATDEFHRYLEVPAAQVPTRTREAATLATEFAALALPLPEGPPRIRWFAPVQDGDLAEKARWLLAEGARLIGETVAPDSDQPVWLERANGLRSTGTGLGGLTRWGEPGVIWVRAGLDPRETAKIALHECRHRWQVLDGMWGSERGPNGELASFMSMEAIEADAYRWVDAQVARIEATAR
jgi:hypothetical protein